MSDDPYFAADASDASERQRLEQLAEIADPITIRHLTALGVGDGWRCLEIGAGNGSVARWLAARVGSRGRVVATDINPRFLAALALSNVETRAHDIVQDDLETGHYDLVHCRAVLMHVAKPMEALDRMIRAVRPGGWLCVEEGDYGLFAAVDLTSPAAERFTQKMSAVFTALHRAGVWDPCFGRRVRGLLESGGMLDVGHDGVTWVSRGGQAGARFHRMSLALVCQPMIAARVLTDDDYAALDQLYEDRSFEFVGPVIFSAWGRR